MLKKIRLLAQSDDASLSMQYLYPILIERLGATDLEGTENLPEAMKPPPSQKPMVIKAPPEDCEEIRLKIAELMKILVSTTEPSALRAYVDDTVNILRTLAMDPHGPVIQEACAAIGELCMHAKDLVFHYAEMIGRSLLTAIVHKHFKVRLAGIDALRKVMYVGSFKYTTNVIEALIGFRDPNTVPIKAFYQVDTKLNYFACLVKDEKEVVREAFFKTLIQWMIDLPDKVDHEGRIVPYILAGLYDPWDSIQKTVFEQFEEIGRIHEEENEKEYREYKQFDYHEEWTYNGDVELLELPLPFVKRPRLGSRMLVKNYMKRYFNAILRELEDWQEENRERSVNLLLCSLVYAEGHVTQFMDKLFVPIYKALIQSQNKIIAQKLPLCIMLIGQYVNFKAYLPIVLTALKGDLLAEYASSQLGAVIAIGYLLQGSILCYPSKLSFTNISSYVKDVFNSLKENCLDQINPQLCHLLVETMNRIIKSIVAKALKNKDYSLLLDNEETIFTILMTCYAYINSADALPNSKEIQNKIQECINFIDSVILKGEGKFMIRNIKSLITKLYDKEFGSLTKHSIELQQILLIYQVLGVDELKENIQKDSKEISLEDCAYSMICRISKESKDKEVIMKCVGILEVLFNKYFTDLSSVSPKITNSLSAIFAADIDPKSILILRRRVLKLFTSIFKSHKRPISDEVLKIFIDNSNKALLMQAKDIEFRKEFIGFLSKVCEEILQSDTCQPELIETRFQELKQVTEICLEEIWNKDEDIRLYASKCILSIINHYPEQQHTAKVFSEPILLGILYANTKPKETLDKTFELLKEEEKLHPRLMLQDIVEKLLVFAVDEGGAPRDNIVNALKRIGKVQTIFLLKEYLVAIVQNFLVRTVFLKSMLKEVFVISK